MISSGELCQFDENLVCIKCGVPVTAEVLPVYRKCGPLHHPEKINFSVDAPESISPSVDEVDSGPVEHLFLCPHRGDISHTTGCGGCGLKTEVAEVYTCEIYGLCTIHAKAIRTDGPSSPLVAVCISCPERPVDGT